jgi:hypothetical protein
MHLQHFNQKTVVHGWLYPAYLLFKSEYQLYVQKKLHMHNKWLNAQNIICMLTLNYRKHSGLFLYMFSSNGASP